MRHAAVSDGTGPTTTTSPSVLAAWWGAMVVLTALGTSGLPKALAVAVIVAAATSGAVLAVLMARHGPHRDSIRLSVYTCAFLATQAAGACFGIVALLPGTVLEPNKLTLVDIGIAVARAGLSLWTFGLVRSWLTHGHTPRARSAGRPRADRLMVGCATTGAALVAFFVANIVNGQLNALLLVPEQSFPLAPGGVEQWLIVTVIVSLAGVIEEPVFVGVAVVLWPRFDRRNFLIAAAVSTLARVSIHLYYAGGTADATIAAIALVILWCAMWSGFNLFLVYRTRRLWPVMLAHGLQNAFAATAGPWIVTDAPRDGLAVAGLMLLLIGVLSLIAIGTLAFAITRVWRRLHARPADTAAPLETTTSWARSDDDQGDPILLCW